MSCLRTVSLLPTEEALFSRHNEDINAHCGLIKVIDDMVHGEGSRDLKLVQPKIYDGLYLDDVLIPPPDKSPAVLVYNNESYNWTTLNDLLSGKLSEPSQQINLPPSIREFLEDGISEEHATNSTFCKNTTVTLYKQRKILVEVSDGFVKKKPAKMTIPKSDPYIIVDGWEVK